MDLPPLSPSAQRVMSDAASECNRRRHFYLGVEHLFSSLTRADESSLARTLAQQGLNTSRFLNELLDATPVYQQPPWGHEIHFTPRCREVLGLATGIAARHGAARVEQAHLIEAILREGHSTPLRRLRAAGVNV